MHKLSLDEIGRLDANTYRAAPKAPITVVLDNVRSLLNVGSFFRTCDAYRIERLYLCGITGTPPHREIHRTALGATDTVPWAHADHTIDVLHSLRAEGYTLLALEHTSNSLPLSKLEITPHQKVALVFGNEVDGIDPALLPLCHQAVEVEQYGTKHSLNVSVCAGVVLYTIYHQWLRVNQ